MARGFTQADTLYFTLTERRGRRHLHITLREDVAREHQFALGHSLRSGRFRSIVTPDGIRHPASIIT
ncbi:hypothetical protein DBZ78_07300 [Salmonella enterica subsp. enterica serovar Brancaster]|uniref:Uncharacterized protein n=4 Tax=Salmonella enterica TaxID=28901 RepID=A0A5T8L927_SALER|nr:hypothetical protein CHD05_03160 [Salmonella enterica]EAA2343027.1 hypothetical protein [Salmonella enterica subsp. enterica serovar Montevideo]EAA4687910.1 hypothetical protein [Salmonella enterica subsp. enterica serovar Hull]EAA5942852.1 hypothetical protein [Salmonella enterica subsp. enterica serovar Isangi]EAA6273303.1 hypothetical protein [Salmonella enterica subsp. enterica serovar Telhashomer]EAA7462573.1 hypothetical protein [Salmonella enterica subsp. enterica serovar Enteritidis